LQFSSTVRTFRHSNVGYLETGIPCYNFFGNFPAQSGPAFDTLETGIPCYKLFCNFSAQSGPSYNQICNKSIENGLPGSGKLFISQFNRHYENSIPGSGNLPIRLVNRHHLIRDICNKFIENRHPGIGIFVRKPACSVHPACLALPFSAEQPGRDYSTMQIFPITVYI
jgi:hypothetical protein